MENKTSYFTTTNQNKITDQRNTFRTNLLLIILHIFKKFFLYSTNLCFSFSGRLLYGLRQYCCFFFFLLQKDFNTFHFYLCDLLGYMNYSPFKC